MPILKNRPPKYQRSGKYAVVYQHGKRIYLGDYGSQESQVAYSRFVAEIQASPVLILTRGETNITVKELATTFLDYAKVNTSPTDYSFIRVIVLDFLVKLYGDGTLVDEFTPKCLKLVREEMVKSRRFCRKIVNRCVNSIISIFVWGVENELVPETTWRALKAVKSLQAGYPGTYENKERDPVPDDIIRRTLPFMPPTLRAMVQLQRILGMRPNEIFKMRVGDIDTTRNNGLWYYVRKSLN